MKLDNENSQAAIEADVKALRRLLHENKETITAGPQREISWRRSFHVTCAPMSHKWWSRRYQEGGISEDSPESIKRELIKDVMGLLDELGVINIAKIKVDARIEAPTDPIKKHFEANVVINITIPKDAWTIGDISRLHTDQIRTYDSNSIRSELSHLVTTIADSNLSPSEKAGLIGGFVEQIGIEMLPAERDSYLRALEIRLSSPNKTTAQR